MKWLLIIFLTHSLFAKDIEFQQIQWGDIPVIWIPNDKIPKFYLTVSFGDGSYSDEKDFLGASNVMFDALVHGTSKYSQKEIAEKFDYYAASLSSSVSGDRTRLTFGGINKDMGDLIELGCHVFNEANFPKKELDKDLESRIDSIKNLVSNPRSLIRRAASYSFYSRTEMNPLKSGFTKTLSQLTREKLLSKRDYFKDKTKKKIYLLGGDAKKAEKLFSKHCGFKNGSIDRKELLGNWKQDKKAADFVFIPLPGTNQAQLRVGQVFNTKEIESYSSAYTDVISNYLGGGFTGKLLTELRTKRGLVYSAGPIIAPFYQDTYSAIATSTKNETLTEVINVINDTVGKLMSKPISKIEFALMKNKVKGSYLFGLEGSQKYLGELMYLDYRGKSFDEIKGFADSVEKVDRKKLQELSKLLYSKNNVEYVVVGDPSVKKQLEKLGSVKEIQLEEIL